MDNFCFIVQGPIDYVDDLIKTYKDHKDNVIVSTNHVSNSDMNKLIDNKFIVLVNKKLRVDGKKNFNNQVLNTYEGIKLAKEMGFKYVMKIRSDITLDNIPELINSLDFDSIYFSAYHNYNGGYLCEHIVFGDVDFMLKLWDIPISTSQDDPEIQLNKNFRGIVNGETIKFIFPILYDKNIKARWIKYKMWLNDYEKDKLFTYEYER
jgi:hypothetical protein